MFENFLINAITSLPGIIIAMVIHEWAHARVAYALGDYTPKLMGRLTLNPAAHVDLLGLVMLFVVHFGWAKPVQINLNNFENPRRADILVSLAGPGANFLTAFVTLLVMIALIKFGFPMTDGMQAVLSTIMIININFGIFNLIPIPPLDGFHVLRNILPYEMAEKLEALERYSFLILIVILMTPAISIIFVPMQRFVLTIFYGIAGIFL